MLLYDPRLKFARDLVGHWLRIRGGALLPSEEDLDPRELLSWLDHLGIADLRQPERLIFELAGAAINRRYGRDIRRVDWHELVPPALGDAGKRIRDRLSSLPCGYYHRFTATPDGAAAVTAETLVLPLRHRTSMVADAVIGITRDVNSGAYASPPGWLVRSVHVVNFFSELVDIGAGAPTDD
jgi:hypothetical protein